MAPGISLVPDPHVLPHEEDLVTLLDFLGPKTFRARNLSSPIRLQHCPSSIKLRVLALRGMFENFRWLLSRPTDVTSQKEA